jgi:hypothetical protein
MRRQFRRPHTLMSRCVAAFRRHPLIAAVASCRSSLQDQALPIFKGSSQPLQQVPEGKLDTVMIVGGYIKHASLADVTIAEMRTEQAGDSPRFLRAVLATGDRFLLRCYTSLCNQQQVRFTGAYFAKHCPIRVGTAGSRCSQGRQGRAGAVWQGYSRLAETSRGKSFAAREHGPGAAAASTVSHVQGKHLCCACRTTRVAGGEASQGQPLPVLSRSRPAVASAAIHCCSCAPIMPTACWILSRCASCPDGLLNAPCQPQVHHRGLRAAAADGRRVAAHGGAPAAGRQAALRAAHPRWCCAEQDAKVRRAWLLIQRHNPRV